VRRNWGRIRDFVEGHVLPLAFRPQRFHLHPLAFRVVLPRPRNWGFCRFLLVLESVNFRREGVRRFYHSYSELFQADLGQRLGWIKVFLYHIEPRLGVVASRACKSIQSLYLGCKLNSCSSCHVCFELRMPTN
jgi:hypothetical protein